MTKTVVAARSIQVVIVGASPIAVLIDEIVIEASTEFHHSNVRLPLRLERVLSWLQTCVSPNWMKRARAFRSPFANVIFDHHVANAALRIQFTCQRFAACLEA